MKPYIHAINSAKRYGGNPDDYIEIHNFLDSTKIAWADLRHRAILHNTFGVFLCEKIFGYTKTNSEGKVYSVRDIAEQHVSEDLGGIPTLEAWLKDLPVKDWMGNKHQDENIKRIDLKIEEKKSSRPNISDIRYIG